MDKNVIYVRAFKTFFYWLLFALLLIFAISNRHRNTGTFNWMTPLWADQAGYYVYLPALFIYDFDARAFPDSIEVNTGDGFSLDIESNKVITRYSCGVAILQAPFFYAIHLFAGILGKPQDGFSGIYHQVPNFAAFFYVLFGLIFLCKYLSHYFNPVIRFFVTGALFFGTNLYYYAVDSTGMSHIYSFGLFAFIAWLSKKIIISGREKSSVFLLIWGIVFSMIVLVRPSNILIFPFLFCMDCYSSTELLNRIKQYASFKNIVILALTAGVVFLPQMIYWKYVSGSYIYYSYEDYGFSNWKNPQILELWFSPDNGLFLYSPLYIAAIIGTILMIYNKKENGWVILLTFCALSYLLASWYIFSFGCGFGSRNFVEYTVMFSLPAGHLFKYISDQARVKRVLFSALIVIMVLFNLKLVYRYNRCFHGETWDFTEYLSFLNKVSRYHKVYDFNGSSRLTPEEEFSDILSVPLKDLYCKKATVRSKVAIEDKNSEALLVIAIDSPDSLFYWNSLKLKNEIPPGKIKKLYSVKGEFRLPDGMPENSKISVYIWNINREFLTVRNIKVSLE